jgi:hypothetical protein
LLLFFSLMRLTLFWGASPPPTTNNPLGIIFPFFSVGKGKMGWSGDNTSS